MDDAVTEYFKETGRKGAEALKTNLGEAVADHFNAMREKGLEVRRANAAKRDAEAQAWIDKHLATAPPLSKSQVNAVCRILKSRVAA